MHCIRHVVIVMWRTCISCILSLPFINPLRWPHGIVSILCTLQNHAGSSSSSWILFAFSFMSTVIFCCILFFTYYSREVCNFKCSYRFPDYSPCLALVSQTVSPALKLKLLVEPMLLYQPGWNVWINKVLFWALQFAYWEHKTHVNPMKKNREE